MSTTKNIQMQVFNGTDYDILYPKTIASQVDGIYSTTQMLSDSTKALYGLGSSATPNDVLSWIGNYNKYWWRRCGYTAQKINYSPSEGYPFGYKSSRKMTYFYNVSVDLYGKVTVSLSGEKYEYVWATSLPNISVFKGKYFSTSDKITDIKNLYYGMEGCSIDTSDGATYYVQGVVNVSSVVPAIPTYSYTYLSSNSENAYPTGYSGNYYYEKIGKPLSNINNFLRLKVGTYTGNGKVGIDNPNSLTFDFSPKLLMIAPQLTGISFHDSNTETYFANCGIWFSGMRYVIIRTWRSSSYITGKCTFDVSGNTISWYYPEGNADYPDIQMNESGTIYSYIAIG